MNKNNIKLKLNIFYFVVYGSIACYYPFLTVYFNEKGLSYSQIGILFALNSITAVVFQPLWGIITDEYSSKKVTIFFSMIISSLLAFTFIFANRFGTVFLAILFFMIFESPICSISDAYCYEIIDKNKNLQYGRIRLMGSIGYALTALFLGIIIKITNINSSFFGYFIMIAIGIITLNKIKYKGKSNNNGISFNDIFKIIKNKKFILITLSALVANIAMGANGNYLAILIQKTGGNVSNLGMLWFIIAMSELPVFFFGAKIIKKNGVIDIYLLSIVLYIIRFVIDSFCPNYQLVLLTQIMQSVTYPLYLIATLQYIQDIVPASARTTAITAFTAFSGGIGGFIGNLSGGLIIQYFSVFYLFRIMAIICILALIIGIILKVSYTGTKNEILEEIH